MAESIDPFGSGDYGNIVKIFLRIAPEATFGDSTTIMWLISDRLPLAEVFSAQAVSLMKMKYELCHSADGMVPRGRAVRTTL